MSTVRKKCLLFLAAVVALGILWPHPSAFAQSSPAPSSVLPTGGGQGVADAYRATFYATAHHAALLAYVCRNISPRCRLAWLQPGHLILTHSGREPDR